MNLFKKYPQHLFCVLLLWALSFNAFAHSGQCKWEGGPGATGLSSDPYAYCKIEDCVEDGGLAICTQPRIQPLNNDPSLADGEGWTYSICNWGNESFNSCAQSAKMCQAAGGTPYGANFCGCAGLSDNYIFEENPTMLNSDGPILSQLIGFA